MTLPPSYSWSPVGIPTSVSYEAPQGRRVNVLGAYFSHGPLAGRFLSQSYATLPKSQAKNKYPKHRKTAQQMAQAYGLSAAEVGPIDSQRFLSFVWHVAGRPLVYLEGWKRSRPLALVLDNYSVHKSQLVKDEMSALTAANVHLLFLPSYSPELSEIEPIWRSVKHHEMQARSFSTLRELKEAIETALSKKAEVLLQEHPPVQPGWQGQDKPQKAICKTDKLLCVNT